MSFVIHAVQALLVLLTGLLLWETFTVLRARVPAQTRAVTVGDRAPAVTAALPRLIWTYWPTAPAPEFIQACLNNWRHFAPDHEVRVLDRGSIESWLPTLRPGFDTLPTKHQTEWLRTQVLARHGGIWMDATLLLSRDLAWLHETQRRRAADYVGFYIDRYTTRPALPILENWMMASVPGGRFVTALAAAFDQALDEGSDALLQRLHREGRHAQVAQALTDDLQRDLLMHVTASDLLDRSPQLARLVLLRAEDGPFAWHAAVGWRKRHLFARLALAPCPRMLPAVLTLRSEDRELVERNWRRAWVSPFSALRHLLAPKA